MERGAQGSGGGAGVCGAPHRADEATGDDAGAVGPLVSRGLAPALALALVAVAGACKPADPIGRLCEQLFDCDCQPGMYATVSECGASLRLERSLYSSIAKASGLTYDEACLEDAADLAESRGCKSAAEVALEPVVCSACAPVHGDQPEGAACAAEQSYGFSDCAQHLQCVNAVCADPCKRLAAGQPCADDLGQSLGQCEDGLTCAYATRSCEPKVGEGGACNNGEVCQDGLACDGTNCVGPPGAGEACPQGVCAEGLRCDGGTCGPLPAVGQSCSGTGQCASGGYCNPQDLVCYPLGGEGDPCLGPEGCAAGYTCNNNACEEALAAFCVGELFPGF